MKTYAFLRDAETVARVERDAALEALSTLNGIRPTIGAHPAWDAAETRARKNLEAAQARLDRAMHACDMAGR